MNDQGPNPSLPLPQRTQKTQRVGVEPLRLFMSRNGIFATKMSKLIFQSETVVSQWLGEGTMPQWVLLAIECFDRRQGNASLWLVRPGDKAASLRIVLSSMGIEPQELL